MRLRIGIIGSLAAVILVALVVLAFKVHDKPSVHVPERAITRAERVHDRFARTGSQRSTPPPRPIPPPPIPAHRPPPASAQPSRPQPAARPNRRPQLAAVHRGREGAAAGAFAGLDRVRHAYDSGDYEQALKLASQYLQRHPHDGYALRVAAVAACAVGARDAAVEYHSRMVARDKHITEIRCKRFGFKF